MPNKRVPISLSYLMNSKTSCSSSYMRMLKCKVNLKTIRRLLSKQERYKMKSIMCRLRPTTYKLIS